MLWLAQATQSYTFQNLIAVAVVEEQVMALPRLAGLEKMAAAMAA
jgi:hypothetical protein